MLISLRKFLLGTLALTTTVFFLFFAIVNRETVTLQLTPLPFTLEMRLFMLVGLLILAGTLLGWVVASFECRRRYLVGKETRNRLAALENEVSALRARHSLPDSSASQE